MKRLNILLTTRKAMVTAHTLVHRVRVIARRLIKRKTQRQPVKGKTHIWDLIVPSRDASKVIEHNEHEGKSRLIKDEVNNLDDDILGLILERVDDIPPEYLASVSRRWRWIMLRLPRIWSAVNARLLSEVILRRLSRSKHHGLRVFLDADERSVTTFSYPRLDALIAYSDQWHSLKTALSEDRHLYDLLEEIQEKMGSVRFPTLHHLDISFDTPAVDMFGMPSKRISILTGWTMPSLRSLRLTNILPTHASAESLTHLKIALDSRFNPRVGRRFVDLAVIVDFLASSPGLETLSLEFSCISTHEAHSPRSIRRRNNLQSLQSLHFALSPERSEELDILKNLLQLTLVNAIDAPKLVQLHLRFTDLSSLDLHYVVDSLLAARKGCAHLRALSIEIRGEVDEGVDILGSIFEHLPQIQSLTLVGTMVTTWSAVMNPVSLRTITIKDIADIDSLLWKRIQGLLQLLTGTDWSSLFPEFSRIIVQACVFAFDVVGDDMANRSTLQRAHSLLRSLDTANSRILWID